ncbi:hypothetical protein FOZ63_026143 [Perkinsus olseni]|uniref:Uncharacterized protein n=1 Tax=Perkinsus olseni TaxID=32597 RepID=A0A7J6SYX4_PEROL|nr:hypothetical protein FOZ63_026143 [Perkinsus olseni]
MGVVEDAKQRLEELIEEYSLRNPKIAEPDGAADDWLFRDAVKEQFGIRYDISRMTWLPQGGKKVKSCSKAGGILDTLRLVCEGKARREAKRKAKSSITSITGHRKRKSHEGAQCADRSSDTASSTSSESSASSRGDYKANPGKKMRHQVLSLKCSNAGLRSVAEERLQRIMDLEAEKAAAWNRLKMAEDDDGSEAAESSEPSSRSDSDQVAALMAELDEWKERMEAKEAECKSAVEEAERLRELYRRNGSAIREELKALRDETKSLREILSTVEDKCHRMEAEDGQYIAL